MNLPPATTLRITGKSRIMFIMGDPIDHVIGTALLNAAFAEMQRDLVLVPLHVRPGDLAHMLDTVRKADNMAGTGITIPHKIAARDLVDHLTEAARLAGAVNFVRRNADGTLTGHNVDGAGFLAGLTANGVDLSGQHVAMAGAGGVARPIAFAIAGAGAASLVIRNRDMAKAEALARDVANWSGAAGCKVTARTEIGPADVAINATALGMREDDALPFEAAEVAGCKALAEVVMTPVVTRFLALANATGANAIGGRAMLDPQAELVARLLDGDPA